MEENKLPEFATTEELVEFFETNDMGNYPDQLTDADFEVDIKKRTFLLSVDRDLMKKLAKLAKAKGTSTEALVNSWLEEKVIQAA